MKTKKMINEKIEMLRSSLKGYTGGDEYTASRHGKLVSLMWVLGLQEELTID